jgi:hypothetical protein
MVRSEERGRDLLWSPEEGRETHAPTHTQHKSRIKRTVDERVCVCAPGKAQSKPDTKVDFVFGLLFFSRFFLRALGFLLDSVCVRSHHIELNPHRRRGEVIPYLEPNLHTHRRPHKQTSIWGGGGALSLSGCSVLYCSFSTPARCASMQGAPNQPPPDTPHRLTAPSPARRTKGRYLLPKRPSVFG